MDSFVWTVQPANSSDQYLSLMVSWKRGASWLLTAVYGSPRYAARAGLWEAMHEMSATMDCPWMLVGDFNAVTSDQERWGSTSLSPPRGAVEFASVIVECELIDLGFMGPCFTWQRGRLKERLDRGLANLDWRLQFPDASVTHLNPLKSDHSPLLVSLTEPLGINRHRRPFRMLAAWLTHPEFKEVV